MKLRHRFITAASVLALAGAGMRADAQIIMSYAVDSPQLSFIWQNTDKFDVLDSAYLTVTYSLRYRSSETDDSLSYEDLMDLQMGRAYNAFFSRNLRETDTKNTESINTHMYFSAAYNRAFLGFDLLLGHDEGTLTETNRLPYTTEVIEYTEQIPSITWEYLPEDTLTVMGYLCQAATCSYGGRDWKVYYTDRIPLPMEAERCSRAHPQGHGHREQLRLRVGGPDAEVRPHHPLRLGPQENEEGGMAEI